MVRSFFFLPFDRSVLGCCVESVSWFHLLGQLRSCLCDDEHLHAAAALNVMRMFFPPPFPLYTRPAHINRVSFFFSHFFFFVNLSGFFSSLSFSFSCRSSVSRFSVTLGCFNSSVGWQTTLSVGMFFFFAWSLLNWIGFAVVFIFFFFEGGFYLAI